MDNEIKQVWKLVNERVVKRGGERTGLRDLVEKIIK